MREKLTARRITMTIIGIVIIGIDVGLIKLVGFGSDPFTCFNSGLSIFFHIEFGHVSIITNILILIFMLFFSRTYIGLGTVINMISIGYVCDFTLWFLHNVCSVPFELPFWLRIVLLPVTVIVMCFSVACYITPDLGIAPYDAISYILQDKTNRPFAFYRIIQDFIFVLVGTLLLFVAQGWDTVFRYTNIGTAILTFFTGPLITWMRRHITEPILYKNGKTDALRKKSP